MNAKLLYSAVAIALMTTAISACKDDETPITGIQFEADGQDVSESDGELQSFHPDITVEGVNDNNGRVIPVNLSFDRALAGDVVIKIDVNGTARETPTVNELNDYAILDDSENLTVDGNKITILKGTQAASFSVVVYEDLQLEYDENGDFNEDGVPYETIEIQLESIVSGPGKLGTQTDHTVRILEDDILAYLVWDPQDLDDNANDVDMDLFISFENGFGLNSAEGGTAAESRIIPAGIGTGDVAMSYTYYDGSSNNVLFEAGFFGLAGDLDGELHVEEPLFFQGSYTSANKNKYDQTGVAPKIAQTAVKDGIHYENFSSLNSFPNGGSRTKSTSRLHLDKKQLLKTANRAVDMKSIRKVSARKK